MGDERRDPDVTDQELLAVFARTDERALQPRAVADELPLPADDLAARIEDLDERGLLAVDDEAPGDAWALTAAGADALTVEDEAVETDVEAQASTVTGVASERREQESPASQPPDPQADQAGSRHQSPPDIAAAFDPPGAPREADSRRDALRRVQAYLRTGGPADRADIEADVFPEAPAGYERPDEWWAELVRPGLAAFEGVTFREADGAWRVVEDPGVPTDG